MIIKLLSEIIRPALIMLFLLQTAQGSHTSEVMVDEPNVQPVSPIATPGRALAIARPQSTDAPIINHMYEDVLGLLFKEASKKINPVCLTSVCKFWFHFIREREDPQSDLKFSRLNPFLKVCIKIWWDNEGSVTSLGQFYNAQLVYKRGTSEEKMTLFSSLEDPFKGTFDETDNHLVITTDKERFCEIRGKNENKTVIASLLRQQVEQAVKEDPNHPLAKYMAGWNKKAKVGLFYRNGNHDLHMIDYATTATLSEISSMDLFENWASGVPYDNGVNSMSLHTSDVMLIFEQK